MIATANFAIAQQPPNEVEPKMAPAEAEPPTGTIVKPTKKQLKTIPKALPKKKTTTETTTLKVEELPPLEPTPELETEQTTQTIESTKTEVKPFVETSSKSDPHLFGFHIDLNVPHVLNYGVDYWHSSRWFSAALSMGGFGAKNLGKTSSDPEGINLKISNQEFAARVHPFQGSFYVGALYGSHKLIGEKTATYTVLGNTRTTTLTNTIDAKYLTPHIGWLWSTGFGLTWGMDFGYLSPSNVKTTLDEGSITSDPLYPTLQTQPDYIENRRKLIEESDKIGKTSLPFIALIRVGWLF